jgi:hypothetical protein
MECRQDREAGKPAKTERGNDPRSTEETGGTGEGKGIGSSCINERMRMSWFKKKSRGRPPHLGSYTLVASVMRAYIRLQPTLSQCDYQLPTFQFPGDDSRYVTISPIFSLQIPAIIAPSVYN